MRLQILGLNHNTAPVEIREQVVFAGDEVGRAVERLKDIDGVDEAVLLSTCNRTEFYVITSDGGRERLRSWLGSERNLDPAFADSLFTLDADDAIRHIFRVACGLDSMVLGEPQILGQLKDAFREAQQAGTTGQHLSRLFQHTFSVAKKVRTDTEITALLVGAGVTIDLVAKHLTKKQIGRLFVANRDVERARRLASKHGGYAVPLSELEGTLPEADILITSTASPDAIITREQIQAAMKTRKHRPVFAVDIAVPRDIEASVAQLSDVYLFTIDDLQKVIQEGQTSREAAAIDANRILDEEIRRYLNIERAKQASPVITALREHGEAIRDDVLRKAQRRLDKGVDSREVVEFATASLMKKLLHQPSVRLREAGEAQDREIIDATRKLFGIDDD
jgi:glutamyl-tRNA reductase